jgi:hypothetical protein
MSDYTLSHEKGIQMKSSLLTYLLTGRDERGDVPGWVMITVMSAGLVAVLTAVAGPQLQSMLENALSAVGG